MSTQAKPSRDEATFSAYLNGFVMSIVLTLTAYLLVVHHHLTKDGLVAAAVALALTQFVVQLICFLHLGRETKPRWKLAVFMFMAVLVLILVFGSLWIMNNLNYHMTPAQINQYLNNQDGL